MDNTNEAARKHIRNYFLTTKILYFAIVGGVFLFALAIWIFTGYDAMAIDLSLDSVLQIATPISTVALIVMSFLLYQVRLKAARSQEKMYEKMELYRTAWLVRMMVLDGAGFLNIISFIFTCNELFYYIFGVILLLFTLNYPSSEKFISEMNLSPVEERVIRDHLR
jgi:hypothetical protein